VSDARAYAEAALADLRTFGDRAAYNIQVEHLIGVVDQDIAKEAGGASRSGRFDSRAQVTDCTGKPLPDNIRSAIATGARLITVYRFKSELQDIALLGISRCKAVDLIFDTSHIDTIPFWDKTTRSIDTRE
jgi:hypothetical protein